MTNVSRQQLRQQLRAQRRSLSPRAQSAAATALNEQLQRTITSPCTIACYLANDGEIDLGVALHAFAQKAVKITLPVIHPFTGKHLVFQHYTSTTTMTTNRFGIVEPAPNCTAIHLLCEHDYLLLPLVGFDKKGNRLGMGGGFYDRTLANLEQRPHRRPTLIGIAHDCQQVAQLPVEQWDIPLDKIITPTQRIIPTD